MSTQVSLRDWLQAARPKTLTAAVIPVVSAHLLVTQYSPQHVSVALTSLALFCALLIQIGTNFFNDVIDFKSGVDSGERSGPRRMLQLGKVSENRMRAAAHVCFFSALLCGFPLILKGGWIILGIGIVSILIGYSYSAPPLKLSYRGLAEPFVVLFFGVIAVIGVEWLHTRSFSALGLSSGLALGLLATVLLVINNIRDWQGDAQRGKLTIVARFGPRVGFLEVVFLYTGVFAISMLHAQSLPHPAISFLWGLPAALVLIDLWRQKTGTSLNATLGKAAAAHLVFGLAFCLQLIP